VVPLKLVAGRPVPDARLEPAIPTPAYAQKFR